MLIIIGMALLFGQILTLIGSTPTSSRWLWSPRFGILASLVFIVEAAIFGGMVYAVLWFLLLMANIYNLDKRKKIQERELAKGNVSN